MLVAYIRAKPISLSLITLKLSLGGEALTVFEGKFYHFMLLRFLGNTDGSV
jgi:hypothetical protein